MRASKRSCSTSFPRISPTRKRRSLQLATVSAKGGSPTPSRASRPLSSTRPAPVQTGNLEDDFEKLADCDLVIEAIVERLDIKQALFARLEKVLKTGAVVASNTSGLCIRDMMEGRSEAFKKHFCVMHFFNPVRYMKLLELVAGPDTDPAVMQRVTKFGQDVLGKGIVVAKGG